MTIIKNEETDKGVNEEAEGKDFVMEGLHRLDSDKVLNKAPKINWGDKYPNVSLAMGISVMEPGQYNTACGKGYWECAGGDKPSILLKHPGLNYFKWGSADSVFYWDEDK